MTNYIDLPKKTLLRPDEVARFFSVHVSTVYRWVDEGKVNTTKTGKVLRIFRESVIKLAKRGQ